MPTHFLSRLALLLIGIVLLSLAISLSIRSDIGTSPVSSIPYIYSVITPLSVGTLAILMQILMIAAQILILGRQFEWPQLLQLPASFLFGFAVDFMLWMTQDLQPDLYISKLALCLLSCLITAVAVCLMVKANLIMMAVDAMYFAICKRWSFDFGRCKMWGDLSLVIFALVSILYFTGGVVGLREGTFISAILVGTLIRYVMPYFSFIRFEKPLETNQSQA